MRFLVSLCVAVVVVECFGTALANSFISELRAYVHSSTKEGLFQQDVAHLEGNRLRLEAAHADLLPILSIRQATRYGFDGSLDASLTGNLSYTFYNPRVWNQLNEAALDYQRTHLSRQMRSEAHLSDVAYQLAAVSAYGELVAMMNQLVGLSAGLHESNVSLEHQLPMPHSSALRRLLMESEELLYSREIAAETMALQLGVPVENIVSVRFEDVYVALPHLAQQLQHSECITNSPEAAMIRFEEENLNLKERSRDHLPLEAFIRLQGTLSTSATTGGFSIGARLELPREWPVSGEASVTAAHNGIEQSTTLVWPAQPRSLHGSDQSVRNRDLEMLSLRLRRQLAVLVEGQRRLSFLQEIASDSLDHLWEIRRKRNVDEGILVDAIAEAARTHRDVVLQELKLVHDLLETSRQCGYSLLEALLGDPW